MVNLKAAYARYDTLLLKENLSAQERMELKMLELLIYGNKEERKCRR